MFRDLTSKTAKKLSKEECEIILENAKYGVLSTVGEDGYPYGIGMSHVYKDGCIYFHGLNQGHKCDNIDFNNKVSYFVLDKMKNVPENTTVKYTSVIVFGKAVALTGDEKRNFFPEILRKYSNDYFDQGMGLVDQLIDKACVYKIEVEHISGKSTL
ncbi:MAG: pyridoxamine 5'-phosphate oxidase family protein [Intestinibacter sp.]